MAPSLRQGYIANRVHSCRMHARYAVPLLVFTTTLVARALCAQALAAETPNFSGIYQGGGPINDISEGLKPGESFPSASKPARFSKPGSPRTIQRPGQSRMDVHLPGSRTQHGSDAQSDGAACMKTRAPRSHGPSGSSIHWQNTYPAVPKMFSTSENSGSISFCVFFSGLLA